MLNSRRELACASLLLAACGLDQTAPDPIDLQPSGAVPVLAPPVSLERARPLPLSRENVGWCDLVVHRRDGGPARHSPLRAPASRGNAVSGEPRPLGRIQFARWEKGSRRAVAEASCVVELDGRSARELRLAYARGLDRALGQGLGNGQSSLRAFDGLEGTIWNGEDVDCMLVMLHTIVLDMDCGGVDCGPMATLRMAEEGPVADIFFECDNGCTVDMDYLVYDCGSVGGDVEEGSGESGGEGANYPGWEGDEVLRCHNQVAGITCTLAIAHDTLIARVRGYVGTLPEPFKTAVLDILNDTTTTPRRFQVFTEYIVDSTGYLRGDARGDIINPSNNLLHLWVGNMLGIIPWYETPITPKETLCHEAVHIRYALDHGSEFDTRYQQCMTGGVT